VAPSDKLFLKCERDTNNSSQLLPHKLKQGGNLKIKVTKTMVAKNKNEMTLVPSYQQTK
jgi:hypothetical protein